MDTLDLSPINETSKSEIDHKRINNVEDVLKVDDEVKVRIIDVDQKTGKMKFSRKVLLPKPESKPAE